MINDVTIVITSFKSKDLILSKINFLKHFNLIIIDNSNDKNFEKIISNFKNIIFIRNKKNLGFAKANNQSIPYLNKKFVLIINPDIIFDVNELKKLLHKFNIYDNIGVAVPSLYDHLNNRQNNSKISFLKNKINRNTKENKIKKLLENQFCTGDFCSDYAIGCFMLFETVIFKKVGGFSEDFFIFFEDNDICDRLKKINLVTMEFPDCRVFHEKNTSANYSFFDKSLMAFHHKLSEYIYLNKCISKKKLYLNLSLNFLDYLQRLIFGILTFNKKKILNNLIRISSILYFLIFI